MSENILIANPPDRGEVTWIGSRKTALEQLDAFLPSAGKAYAGRRNYDLGPADRSNISCLSPWIRRRVLLENEVIEETLKRHSFKAAEKFIQEVFWRTYFKGWLEHRPSVWWDYQRDLNTLIDSLDHSSELKQRCDNALQGETGIDCFDAWSKELIETGYLHNHARMWFASIWIFTLQLPWQLGADFFYRNLLDGDPASNTLSWRWVAGLHTKGKHYVARQSNIEQFTNGRFSPKNLALEPAPLMESREYSVLSLQDSDAIADVSNFGLLITEEDCNPESIPFGCFPTGVVGLTRKTAESRLPTNEIVKRFSRDTIKDGVDRSGVYFECQTEVQETDDWGDFLTDWAKDLNVSTIVTPYASIGPVREQLDAAIPRLKEAGIKLLRVRRHYDSLCWPHATRGFFKLREKIPSFVRDLNL